MKETYQTTRYFRYGEYFAEVKIMVNSDERREYDSMTLSEALKLERVHRALSAGDLRAVAEEAQLYKVQPVNPADLVGADAA